MGRRSVSSKKPRKGGRAIEDTEQNLGLIYRAMGRRGLESIENVGPKLAGVVDALIRQWTEPAFARVCCQSMGCNAILVLLP